MSGHSKWSTIKRAKAVTDDKRGRLWSKVARRIMMAAKDGGGDPDMNLPLRYAIDDARAANMPKDNIAKAIKKGTGELGGQNYEQIVYEGYGPGGVSFLVDCLTDNRNRTAPELRKVFERGNGQLGSTNCVAWMFESKGSFLIAADVTDAYGPAPKPASVLIQMAELRIAAGSIDVVRLKLDGPDLIFSTRDTKTLMPLLKDAPGRVSLVDPRTIYYRPPENYLKPPETLLAVLRKLLVRSEGEGRCSESNE